MKIIIVPCILILLWVLSHNIRKKNYPNKESLNSFLAREDQANATRKKDISKLPYIKVPFNMLPFDITLNDTKKQTKIVEYQKIIYNLSDNNMLNLIGISNTELKECYGPANLPLLTACDQNYSQYIRTLHLWAECIYDEYPEQAISMLEYCISIGTDISGTYDLLSEYYLLKNNQEQFLSLYDKIPEKESISGKTILQKLDQQKNYFL